MYVWCPLVLFSFLLVFELVLNRILSRFLKYFHFHHGYNKFAACPNWQQQSLREQVLNLSFVLWSLSSLLAWDFCYFGGLGVLFVLFLPKGIWCSDVPGVKISVFKIMVLPLISFVTLGKSYNPSSSVFSS